MNDDHTSCLGLIILLILMLGLFALWWPLGLIMLVFCAVN